MKILQITDLNVDSNGLELIEHAEAGNPISIYFDETDKYTQGFIRRHWHPHLEFVLAVTALDIHLSDELVHIAPGEGIFINAGQLHMFVSPAGAPRASFYTLLLHADYIAPCGSLIHEKLVRPIAENAGLPCIVFRRDSFWHSYVLDSLHKAVDLCRANAHGCELAVRNEICGIWLSLTENLSRQEVPVCSRHSRQNQHRVKQMLEFIRSNYANRISLEDISRAALVSKSECLRVFRSCFDMTPVQYLTHYRLELACHQLRTTGLSVKEIAYRCGFEDAGYFGRIFRKNLGLTPREYRRSHSEGGPAPGGECA